MRWDPTLHHSLVSACSDDYDAAVPLPDYADALDAALKAASPLAHVEVVELSHAVDRVLGAPVVADRALPPFNRAMMDGYALRAAEFGTIDAWPVVAVISAGTPADVRVPPGTCVAIATGASLPEELDTVIQHEVSDRGDLDGQPVRFNIASITSGASVHPRGSDARQGDVIIPTGVVLRPHHLGIAASVGTTRLTVVAKPRIMILTSGDEVVSPASDALPHQIRNSNGPMLASLLEQCGGSVVAHHHVPDELDATIRAVGDAICTADLIITVGGVSAGERDHFPAAFDEHRVERAVHGAMIQPGRPIFVGCVNNTDGALSPTVIALPGNPVSALACACLFAWPILRLMLGLDPSLPWRRVALREAVKPNARRRAFRPAILNADGTVTVPHWSGSGDLCHTMPTSGLLELPVQADAVEPGTELRFLPWP